MATITLQIEVPDELMARGTVRHFNHYTHR